MFAGLVYIFGMITCLISTDSEEWRRIPVEGCTLEVSNRERVRSAGGSIVRHDGHLCLCIRGREVRFSVKMLREVAFRPIPRPRRRYSALSAEQVAEIRREGAIDHSSRAIRRIAENHGASLNTIVNVIACRTWKTLPGNPPPRLRPGRPRH